MKQHKVKRIGTGKIIMRIILITQITVQTGCVKAPPYDTDHPGHGRITLTTDWRERGEGIDIPGSHTAHIGSHTAVLSGERNTIDHLFEAGTHPIHIYNVAENISLPSSQSQSSHPTVATANYTAGALGWFFTGAHSITTDRDKHHEITVPMRQQVRQLTLELEITGNAADRITAIEATLSGVAGVINIENGNPVGDAVTVAPAFTKTNGRYSATIRLLGITGTVQTLTLNLYADNGAEAAFTVTSDLASQLVAFNTDKKTPFTLHSGAEVKLTEAGFTATIDGWQSGNTGNIIAD